MENKSYMISLEKNPIISVKVTPGHFTTHSAHISHYIDMSMLKSNASVAKNVAREIAIPYLTSTLVDTIICIENTKVIGAYLAEELLQQGVFVMNDDREINVITPMTNSNGNLIFYDSEVDLVKDKNILLLTTSISTGKTLDSVLECIDYYKGKISGISALFLVDTFDKDIEINTLFTSMDIQDYSFAPADQCEMCKAKIKLDAFVGVDGYLKI